MNIEENTVDMSRFECRRCGECCRWGGSVLLTENDLDPLADYLGISCNEFLEKFTEVSPNRRGLRLIDPPDMTCLFLKDGRCAAYAARPQQCRDFPHKWRVSEGCPGLDALKTGSQ